ncbi:MAG: hypothetical protein QM771_08470 [Nitrospira sp.]
MYYSTDISSRSVAVRDREVSGTARQLVPIGALLMLVGLAIAAMWSEPSRQLLLMLVGGYVVADFAVSVWVGLSGGIRCAAWMLLVFPVLHASYGIGYLRGIIDFWIRKRHASVIAKAMPLSR